MNIREFLENVPAAEPRCPECDGIGWVEIDGMCGRCDACMPPSFVVEPNGVFRQGRRDLDGPPLMRIARR
ncbi:MAG: hypothetical protein ABSG53_27720 [Thermoguttaceae bacterium]|jgi:hypothetical protein